METRSILDHHPAMIVPLPSIGELLRLWRERRRLSQLALALDVGISQRHLSFVESGRSRPSRDVVLRLAEHLQVPLREQNAMLVAAGHAPAFTDRPLASSDMVQVRSLIERILKGHEPHPALVLDRGWKLFVMNRTVAMLTEGVDPSLLEGEVNALRLTLHPLGLAPRIVNFAAWRGHILRRLSHGIDLNADRRLIELLEELKSYPAPCQAAAWRAPVAPDIAVPLILDSPGGPLSFLSATTIFGTAVDVTLADLVIV
jgi:transcriptional regulator with XRE-family HTH domain